MGFHASIMHDIILLICCVTCDDGLNALRFILPINKNSIEFPLNYLLKKKLPICNYLTEKSRKRKPGR